MAAVSPAAPAPPVCSAPMTTVKTMTAVRKAPSASAGLTQAARSGTTAPGPAPAGSTRTAASAAFARRARPGSGAERSISATRPPTRVSTTATARRAASLRAAILTPQPRIGLAAGAAGKNRPDSGQPIACREPLFLVQICGAFESSFEKLSALTRLRMDAISKSRMAVWLST
jgi:hypothetical protein